MLLNMVMFKVTICDLKNKDRNMADNIEHQDKGELVANCDRFYSHHLKASCAPMATFISSMHHYRQIVRKLRTISDSTVELYSRADTLYRYTYSLQNDVRKKNTKNNQIQDHI